MSKLTTQLIKKASEAPTCSVAVQNDELTIGVGTTIQNLLPAYGLYDFNWGAMIYTSTEVGAAKQITGVGFNYSGFTSGYTFLNQRIYLAHVVESVFPPSPQVNMSDLTLSNLTEVKGYFTNTISSAGYKTFTFDENFCYNGTSNLLVFWQNNDGSWQSGFGGTRSTTSTNRAAYKFQDNTYPSGTGTRTNARPNIKILF